MSAMIAAMRFRTRAGRPRSRARSWRRGDGRGGDDAATDVAGTFTSNARKCRQKMVNLRRLRRAASDGRARP
jgi:hypothetical protein